MIKVESLSKNYDEHQAVKDISFEINRGEIVGFLGPNGAGKSTTMKMLAGYLAPSSGKASIAGFDVGKNPIEAKSRLGYLPEIPPVYTDMYVEEYLLFASRLHGASLSEAKVNIEEAMKKCGLLDVRARIIANLSKGFRQRVGLAQAIANKAEVLILDEPTVGLDPKQIIEIRDLISSLAGDHTVILSTHILSEVQATCKRVIVIDKGQIVADDSLQGIVSRMEGSRRLHVGVQVDPGEVIADLEGKDKVLNISPYKRLEDGDFSFMVEYAKDIDMRADIAQLIVSKKLGLLHLSEEKFSLEDAFVSLVSKEDKNEFKDNTIGGAQ